MNDAVPRNCRTRHYQQMLNNSQDQLGRLLVDVRTLRRQLDDHQLRTSAEIAGLRSTIAVLTEQVEALRKDASQVLASLPRQLPPLQIVSEEH